MKSKYPVRCEIIDVDGVEIKPGLKATTPEISRPHIGKQGLAEKIGQKVRITLDDKTIIWGHECW